MDTFSDDYLDQLVLKERRKLLLRRKLLESENLIHEQQGNYSGISEVPAATTSIRIKEEVEVVDTVYSAENQFCGKTAPVVGNSENCSPGSDLHAVRIKEEIEAVNEATVAADSKCIDITGADGSTDVYKTSTSSGLSFATGLSNGLVCGLAAASNGFLDRSVKNAGNEVLAAGKLSKGGDSLEFSPIERNHYVFGNSNSTQVSDLQSSFRVKAEQLHYKDIQDPENGRSKDIALSIAQVEHEQDVSDGVDNMLLQDRIKLLTASDHSGPIASENFECMGKSLPCLISPEVSQSIKPIRILRTRKRKRTATDSVETAMEEDAPGLLQVLLDQGVSINEIKLYGQIENDDPIDDSFSEDNFSDLEAVIAKLFMNRSSLLKLAPLRCAKGSKPSYCLACLFSLVEQARYLQFRKWPVEWGWCRDLQSFVFVFRRHNRIVLERPEYGFATYFFELLDSLPVDWQVKRLVTAMKLTSCGRISLIENKHLAVGEDLTGGEAEVLMEYGWIPNTGLGSMLNYRDRVVHDRKNESNTSEWRSKIGKLLMDGFDGGTTVSTSLPTIAECRGENTGEAANFHIKLET